MTLKKMVDGLEVECSPEEEKEIFARWEANVLEQKKNEWINNRKSEYPSIVDQLDMLWHAMDNGEIPFAIEFYKTIKEIKQKYPKS